MSPKRQARAERVRREVEEYVYRATGAARAHERAITTAAGSGASRDYRRARQAEETYYEERDAAVEAIVALAMGAL